jgi:hypothetical protein
MESVRIELLAAALAVGAAAAYVLVRHERYAALDAVLLARAEQAAAAPAGDLPRLVQFGGRDFGDGMRPALVYADGVQFFPHRDVAAPLGDEELAVATRESPRSIRTVAAADGTRVRRVAVPAGPPREAPAAGGTIPAALVLAQPLDALESDLRDKRNLAALVAAAGVVTAASAWRRGCRRISCGAGPAG